MKKMLLSAAALLLSVAAFAQAPVLNSAPRPGKSAAKVPTHTTTTKQHTADDDHDDQKAGAPANHGQTVQAFAKNTPLTGADKGAAISALASNGRAGARSQRPERSARGEHSHSGNRPAGSGHQGSSHQAGAGHRGGH